MWKGSARSSREYGVKTYANFFRRLISANVKGFASPQGFLPAPAREEMRAKASDKDSG